jgi:hypothetical protein
MGSEVATLTLQDIADLAHVQRPVVSMWRRRPMVRGELMPFPESVGVVAGVERFGREQIVDWLDRTGRGNNIEHRYDAPAFAVPDDVELDELVALLCLCTLTGEELTATTVGDRSALAEVHDRADLFLLREIRTIRPSATVLSFIDDLVEASYGPADALDRLESGRLSRVQGGREVTPEMIEVVRAVAIACGNHIDAEGAPLLYAGDALLSLALADAFAELVVTGSSDLDRNVWRRALIRGVDVSRGPNTPHVSVCSVVGLDVGAALNRIDDVVLGLGKGDIAIIAGPASALCDLLTGENELDRSKTLRAGNLAMAIRLPRGLWREVHRQSLGLWVCQGGREVRRPRVSDLGALAGNQLDLSDLAADVAGALTESGGRAFRYARDRELAPILAGEPVVPRGVRAIRMGVAGSTSYLEKITTATLTTRDPLEPLDILVEPAPGKIRLRQRSLGELRDARLLVMRRGSRIDPTHADQAGTVLVRTADRGSVSMKLDAFDAARLYPRAIRTEPGDVIFLERPHPVAIVDTNGGSLVSSPSRVLRLSPSAGIGPHALAAVINGELRVGTEWETWAVPELRDGESERLESALIDAHGFETRVQRRLEAVHELTRALVEGVAAGSVTLAGAPTTSRILTKHSAQKVT